MEVFCALGKFFFYSYKIMKFSFLKYRDEKADFKEEIERLKKLRGKGKRERKIPPTAPFMPSTLTNAKK